MKQVFPTAEAALERFAAANEAVAKALGEAPPEVVKRGLVNRTYAVGKGPDFALQAVAPAFGDAGNARINPVAAELARAGVLAPRLIAPAEGTLSLAAPEGRRWRLLTWIAGEVFEPPPAPAKAHGAGALLARFHDGLWRTAAGEALPLSSFHDTDAHMARLRAASAAADAEIADTAATILGFWEDWRGAAPATVPRPGHGDLKLTNFIFAAGTDRAVGIVDFDTLGRYRVNEEFGDAARSWCNRLPEDDAAAAFDIAVFASLADGYLSQAKSISQAERESLVDGAGRIAIELSARFCIDAVEQCYFAWDPALAPDARSHNLRRARGQCDLARQIAERRGELEQLVR